MIECSDMTPGGVELTEPRTMPLSSMERMAVVMCMDSSLGMMHNELVRSYRQLGGPDRVALLMSQLTMQKAWDERTRSDLAGTKAKIPDYVGVVGKMMEYLCNHVQLKEDIDRLMLWIAPWSIPVEGYSSESSSIRASNYQGYSCGTLL